LFELDGEVVVVTGANDDFGAIWLEGLLLAGANVVGIDQPEAAMSKRCMDLQARFGASRLQFYHADFTDRSQLIELRDAIEKSHGVVSILVNCTGSGQANGGIDTFTLLDSPLCQYHDVLALNVDTIVEVTQVFAASMLQRHYGSIINIGSFTYHGLDQHTIQAHIKFSSKRAGEFKDPNSNITLVDLTQYLATHWAAQGVRVNSLSTKPAAYANNNRAADEAIPEIDENGQCHSDYLVGPLLFLASKASAQLTGQELFLSNGYPVN
jgi:NAD(P)-dependent dehydrogenase (short-subunit alcohol dehydrogenase family)